MVLPLGLASCGGGGTLEPLPEGWILGVPDDSAGAATDDDIDGDGVANAEDNCPSIANADQRASCAYTRPPAVSGTDVVQDGLTRLNHYRLMLGLPPVVASDTYTRGCEAHLAYLTMLSAEGEPQLTYEEDPSKPYYSAEGAQAGRDSVLSMGTEDIGEAIDEWIGALYHRLPLLHPGLSTVGIAHDGTYACLQFRGGTSAVVTPHPVRWPAPDHLCAERQYAGEESPCPTSDDPFAPGQCPPSGTIATLGLSGLGAITDVSGTLTRISDGTPIELSHTYWDGGASPHEQEGYLIDSIALVPRPNTELATGEYEVSIDATVGGQPRSERWRFQINDPLHIDVMCDLFGPQGSFDTAVPVTVAEVPGRLCDTPHYFRIRDTGAYRITVEFDPCVAPMEVLIFDAARTQLRAESGPTPIVITDVPGTSYIEIRSRDGASGPYRLTIE